MKNTTTTTTNGHEITVSRIWSFHSVRDACIRNDLYTRGTCSEYDKMLDMVENTEPTVAALYEVAKDINDHNKQIIDILMKQDGNKYYVHPRE